MAQSAGAHLHTVLPPTPDSVRKARELVRSLCAGTAVHADTDTVLLLVSELVSNAVKHTSGALEISARQAGSTLRVEVSDGSPAMPALQDHSVDSTGGRGLQMVDKLADRWGADRTGPGPGKTVWFEIGPSVG